MTKQITSLQAMRHPTVVATINVLSETTQRLQDEINKLKAALAQPEQEPLEYWNAVEGWVKIDEVREHFDSVGCGTIYKTDGEGRAPLYTSPPQRPWVGLTDEERDECDWGQGGCDYARIIEAKLKQKNT